MREIKFRAWDTGLNFMMPVENINFNNEFINVNGIWRMFFEIILMQYTGLKDKNGTEIYEGDILNIIEVTNEGLKEYLTDVKWEDCSFVVKSGEDDYDTFLAAWTGDPNYTYPLFEVQVIGNIY